MALHPNVSKSPSGRGARLRVVGVCVLLAGLGLAGVVYWTGAPPEDLSADPDTARAYKTGQRNIEINFGKMGLMMNDWMEDLSHPGTQAGLIAAATILAASGCFFFAQLQEREDDADGPMD